MRSLKPHTVFSILYCYLYSIYLKVDLLVNCDALSGVAFQEKLTPALNLPSSWSIYQVFSVWSTNFYK